MKKKLNVTWENVQDSTGYLFSLAKSLSAAVKHSPYPDYAEDIVATSGFAFRMWVSADLCPSATSIWSFDEQKPWVENGGLSCKYVGRYWGEDAVEEKRRLEAIANIKESVDNGLPAVSWDIGVPEWGLITGYDDDTQLFSTLAVSGQGEMAYDLLGKRELPLLSVLTVTGTNGKSQADILRDTMKLAASHLRGEEWSENARGLAAYSALTNIFEESPEIAASWNAEYFLGTYGALKEYAYKYFQKAEQKELANIYKEVFGLWIAAFKIKTNEDAALSEVRNKILSNLKAAQELEKEALKIMETF